MCKCERNWLFLKTGDIKSLKDQLITIIQNRQDLLNLSINCINAATNITHIKMHSNRLELMQNALTQYESGTLR